jgi:hypothetical protein
LREAYEVNGQTAWSLLTKAERFKVRIVTNLSDEQVRRMHLPRDRWKTLADIPPTHGCLMPRHWLLPLETRPLGGARYCTLPDGRVCKRVHLPFGVRTGRG